MSASKQVLATYDLPDGALERTAAYFQALSEPSRLRLLNLLCSGEASVGDLAQACGLSIANVSRHLALLAKQGLVKKELRGNSAIYDIADPTLHQICDLVCSRVANKLAAETQTNAAIIKSIKTTAQ